MPGRHIPHIRIPNFDKVVHVSIYMIFGALTFYGWTRQTQFTALHRQTILKIIILLALYGFTIEVMQGTLTVDRSFDLFDELANTIGATIGTYIASKALRNYKAS
jgi:VanZ family protein